VCWVLGWRCNNSLVASFLLCFFSPFFKTLLLFYSLKSRSLDSHCPMFPLISSVTPKVSVLKTHSIQQPAAAAAATPHKAANQPTSSFRESFIYSHKRGGATNSSGRGVAHDIITRETCDRYSLNVNIL
jgi:hypothetical protein